MGSSIVMADGGKSLLMSGNYQIKTNRFLVNIYFFAIGSISLNWQIHSVLFQSNRSFAFFDIMDRRSKVRSIEITAILYETRALMQLLMIAPIMITFVIKYQTTTMLDPLSMINSDRC